VHAVEALAGTGDEPAVRIEALALRAELRQAFADLSVRERTALALRYVHDLPDEEIAAAMRCRPGTVRSLLSRAGVRLRVHPALAGRRSSSQRAKGLPQQLIARSTDGRVIAAIDISTRF
jgi:DNA-directed RNA polymerase specialized sigma24 family protein